MILYVPALVKRKVALSVLPEGHTCPFEGTDHDIPVVETFPLVVTKSGSPIFTEVFESVNIGLVLTVESEFLLQAAKNRYEAKSSIRCVLKFFIKGSFSTFYVHKHKKLIRLNMESESRIHLTAF